MMGLWLAMSLMTSGAVDAGLRPPPVEPPTAPAALSRGLDPYVGKVTEITPYRVRGYAYRLDLVPGVDGAASPRRAVAVRLSLARRPRGSEAPFLPVHELSPVIPATGIPPEPGRLAAPEEIAAGFEYTLAHPMQAGHDYRVLFMVVDEGPPPLIGKPARPRAKSIRVLESPVFAPAP